MKRLFDAVPADSKAEERAWDVVRREFEDWHTRAFMLWLAFMTLQPLDNAGTGWLAYSLLARPEWRSIPRQTAINSRSDTVSLKLVAQRHRQASGHRSVLHGSLGFRQPP